MTRNVRREAVVTDSAAERPVWQSRPMGWLFTSLPVACVIRSVGLSCDDAFQSIADR